MEKLNLPEHQFRYQQTENGVMIFDDCRKKFVKLTPEEWVRQNFIHYLNKNFGYPLALTSVERAVNINGTKQRSDIVLFDRKGNARLIVECKATSVKIDQRVFDQVARYNMDMKVDYLVVTNGISHFYCKIDWKKRAYAFIKEIPSFDQLPT